MTRKNVKLELKQMLHNKQCVISGSEITLSSGIKSNTYFDCRRATLDGKFLDLLSTFFLDQLSVFSDTPTAVGGLTMGADCLTAAIILKSYQCEFPTTLGSIVRKHIKLHGMGKLIENELPSGTQIVIVDDVITSGNSILSTADIFINAGYSVVGVFALIDRELGGVEKIKTRLNCPVVCVFQQTELTES